VSDRTQRLFVAGKRSADLSGTVRVSRALQVATVHYYRVTCGPLVATGSFTTANLVLGKSYPEFPPVDPSTPGDYAWPDMPYSDPNAQMIDPTWGLLYRPLSHPGEGADYWPSGSQTNHCSPTTVNGGHHCLLGNNLYWINPTTGEGRFLGYWGINMYLTVNGDDLGGSGCSADSGTFDPTNANVFYCQAGTKAGPAVMLRGTYTGGDVAIAPKTPAAMSWENLTPVNTGHGLHSLAQNFDSTFDVNAYAAGPEVRGVLGNGMIVLDFKLQGQDSAGWLCIFDPSAAQFVGMAFTGTAGIHSYTPVLQSASWSSATLLNMGFMHWNYLTDPHGHNLVNDTRGIGHAFVADKAAAGSTGGSINVRTGDNFADLLNTPGKNVTGGPTILGYGAAMYENFVENYTAEGAWDGSWILNTRPIEADNGTTAFSSVSGQLFRVGLNSLEFDVNGSGGIRRKIFPTFAYCGSHPLLDVSGPGSTINDTVADSYKYCQVENDGECQDSAQTRATQAGEIYANCPSNDGTACAGGERNKGLCIIELAAFSGPVSQEDTRIPANGSGNEVRPLSWGFRPFHYDSAYYWSARALPDGSWAIIRANGYQRSNDAYFVAKMPPPALPDGVNRTNFVPVAVQIPAQAGASRAWVKFGYGENGPATSFCCTSRQESCAAADALGQRSGTFTVGGGTNVYLAGGDNFDTDTWAPGGRILLRSVEWPITAVNAPNFLTIGNLKGPGTVSASGGHVSFSNPGECVKHGQGTRITASGTTVTVTGPWECDGKANNHVQVDNASVTWTSVPWTWDLGDLGQNTFRWASTFHYASETFNGQPCASGCTVLIPAISQRVVYYQIVYDSGATWPVQVAVVP